MSPNLSTAELAQIRADIANTLPDTCSILAIIHTSDGAGGWSDSAGTIAGGTSVPCRIDFAFNSGKEHMSNATLTPFKSGVVSMAYDKTITTANQIQIGSTIYNITGVNDQQSWIGVKRCTVERIP